MERGESVPESLDIISDSEAIPANYIQEDEEAENMAFAPPSELETKHARKKRNKEKRMTQVMWEIFGYGCYLILLFTLCNSNTKGSEYQWSSHIRDMFATPFEQVTTVQGLWEYMENVLIPRLYAENDPTTGKRMKWRDRQFTSDLTSFRIGPARMRQIRRPARVSAWRKPFQKKYEQILKGVPGHHDDAVGSIERDFEAGNWSRFLGDRSHLTPWFRQHHGNLEERDPIAMRNEALMDGDLWQISYLYAVILLKIRYI